MPGEGEGGLRWNHPVIRAVGWIKIRSSLTCAWCNEGFVRVRRLDQRTESFCSNECRKQFRIVRRTALGIRAGGAKGVQGVAAGSAPVKPRTRKQKKRLVPVGYNPVGDWTGDALAAQVGIPRLSMSLPMPVGLRCHYCGSGSRGGVGLTGRKATTRDHIVPVAAGGSNQWWNLVPACAECNQAKGDAAPDCTCGYCTRSVSVHAKMREISALSDLANPGVV